MVHGLVGMCRKFCGIERSDGVGEDGDDANIDDGEDDGEDDDEYDDDGRRVISCKVTEYSSSEMILYSNASRSATVAMQPWQLEQ